jgi:Fur family transcriptional regulator, ferric uptake regulator
LHNEWGIIPDCQCFEKCMPGETAVENQELRNAGLKVTLPRVKILEILERSDQRHMSAEDMYKALLDSGEDIGLATVYRVMTQFESAGLVTRHHFEGGHSVFELNQGDHHDHIVCVKCGRVDEFVDSEIEKRQKQIAVAKGYEITDHSLYLYGICSNCRKSLHK